MAILFLAFAFAYWLFERLTGRKPSWALGLIHFTSTVLLPMILGPVHLITASSSGRDRYYDYSSFSMFDGAFDLSALVTTFAWVALIGQLAFVINIFWFAKRGISEPS